jgi:hypothetical protein
VDCESKLILGKQHWHIPCKLCGLRIWTQSAPTPAFTCNDCLVAHGYQLLGGADGDERARQVDKTDRHRKPRRQDRD